jgi:hypothetical protein
MPTSAIEILTGVRDLLSDPERWTQGASARNAKGEPVDVHSEEATCFCAVGALYRIAFPDGDCADPVQDEVYWKARWRAKEFLPEGKTLISVNDLDGREAVLDLLDKAIGAAA